jgi:hypothetical protein
VNSNRSADAPVGDGRVQQRLFQHRLQAPRQVLQHGLALGGGRALQQLAQVGDLSVEWIAFC